MKVRTTSPQILLYFGVPKFKNMFLFKYQLLLQFLCFFTLSIVAQPAQEWYKSHNGTAEESHGHFILSCSDGGFLQVGETGFIPNSAKILVVKTDANGNLLWKKEFGSSGHNLGNSAYETNDSYLICGALNQNSALIKLNKTNGNTIFSKTYNNGGADALEHIAETPNGLVAVGYINALDVNNTFYTEGQGYLTLLDLAGNKTNGININDYTSHAYRVQAYDGALLIAGLSAGAEAYNLLKYDFLGNRIWSQNFGGDGNNHCFGMDINANGEIFLTGHTTVGTQNWDTYTLKLASNGNLLWEMKTGNPRGFNPNYIHDEAWGIKATADGGCIIVAGSGDEYESYSSCNTNGCSDVWRVYLIKYAADGTLEWQQTYFTDNSIDWAGEDIDLTSDGGAIVAVDDGTFGFLKIAPFTSALPIELTDFQVEIDHENAALLTWITAMEANAAYFEIEYSTDSENWTYVAEIAAIGNAQQGANYTFTDTEAADNTGQDGIIYYRLKWVDADGEFSFSSIRSVNFAVTDVFSAQELARVKCFPNPIPDQLTIANVPTTATYQIFSANGVLQKNGVLKQGVNLLQMSDLGTGVYYISIQNQGERIRLTLVKI